LVGSFKLQPEIFFDNQSNKYDGATANFNYLSVPVLAKYGFKNTGFSLLAGPQIGFLLSAKAKGDGVSQDLKSNLQDFNFGLAFGAEYALPLGLVISARYNYGLTNIDKTTIVGSSDKLSSFTLALGYSFGK